MATLLFFDTNHTYQLDGEILPSVSEITRFISREVYGDINQFTLDNACNRGSNVHKATEVLDKYNEVECNEEILPYVQAYIQFRKDYHITSDNIAEIESAYGSKDLGYAGTIDRILKVNDEYWLVDLKTSCTPQKPLWSACLNGYKLLWEEHNTEKKITRMFDLQLKKDGTYKVIDMEQDNSVFLSCLTLHKTLKKKKRIKKECN